MDGGEVFGYLGNNSIQIIDVVDHADWNTKVAIRLFCR
jgi:hypothetical protein